ncbi:hypothetical protein ZIOFF_043783 [Zingiber officinale]|uniref:Glycoside hydrolase family 31 TIM barrel domain-containing protein n=1 Tax=Zingiber officinale TaxID=94328 RepID=A0A8J5FXY5_ZINOF|nr:hypothetical protein ZIOFF_043783 [Zingiber officinale]
MSYWAFSVVNGYKRAQIPLDVIWNDDDHMDTTKDFTLDPVNSPHPKLLQFLDRIHSTGMKYIVLIDLGITINSSYAVYHCGITRDIFIKYKCGPYVAQGFEASCSAAGDAIISLPDLGPCKLISMNFESLRIKLGDERADQCSLQKLIYANLTGSIYGSYTLVRCPSGIATDSDSIRGPIPCLSNESQGQFVYQVDASASMDLLPSQCEGTGSAVGRISYASGQTFQDQVQRCTQTLQMDLYLYYYPGWVKCLHCHREGKQCGFSRSRGNQTACFIRARPHEWVYDRLVERQDLVLTTEVEEKDGEIMKKLSKVALWCIQWNPTERPTMTRILHMLTSSEEVLMPPKPFVSNINHDYAN